MNLRHVLGSGLLGFVLGAFVVASFQNIAAIHSGRHPSLPRETAIDEPASATPAPSATATSGRMTVPAASSSTTVTSVPPPSEAERELAERNLAIPVQGVNTSELVRSFADPRTGHEHGAIDILAPRNTPVLAVEDGTIAKLFVSKLGGNTIYQFDPAQRFCYYYAHLERYAEGLKEGDAVHRGQVLGYVGTTGNAPPNTPHLHFAITILNADHHWWEGTAIDPYDVLAR